MKVKWDAYEQADRISSMSTLPLKANEAPRVQTSWVPAAPCRNADLVDMVDQFPDPPRERIHVKISFVAILVGDEEKLLVHALVLSFGQVDIESPDQTK